MPARGLKRTASNASASGSSAPKIKKKHGVQLEVPARNKVRGRLLACGQGDVGQLGLGEDVMETTRFKFVSALGEKIVDACAGGMHTVALDSDGKVWTFGCNDEGALGRQAEEFSVGSVDLPLPAVAISAGDSHTAALLENGDVYLWGSFRDSHGSMGLICSGREGKACHSPVRLALPEHVAAIASGGDHLVALTVTGAVYTCGCGEQGQLGRLAQRSASRHARAGLNALLPPQQVTLKVAVRRVWAGSHATLALSAAANKIFAWGLNNYNQLGITGAKKKTALYTPLEADAFSAVEDVESWTQIACGQHHSLALDNNGKCYAVGRCDYGRLGLGEGSGDAEAVTPVPKLQEKMCISIAAATSSSFAVTDNGEVYAWGMGSEGQLGTGSEDDQPAPHLVTVAAAAAHKPVKVSAGGQHTLLLVANVTDGEEEPTPSAPVINETQKAEVKPSVSKPRGKQRPVEQMDVEAGGSAARAMEVDEKKPEKLNGEEEPTPMETDETDKPQDKPTDNKESQETTDKEAEKAKPTSEPAPTEDKTETEPEKKETEPVKTEGAPETTETVTKTEAEKTKVEEKQEEQPAEPAQNETEAKSEQSLAETAEKDVEMAEKVTDSTEKVIETAEKVKETAENVKETAENVIETAENKVETVEKDIDMVEKTVNGEGELKTEIVEKKLPSSEETKVVTEAL